MFLEEISWLPGGVVGALVGFAVSWKRARNEEMTAKTDGDVKVSRTILEYAESLRRDIQTMKAELELLEAQISSLKTRNLELCAANESMCRRVALMNEKIKSCPRCGSDASSAVKEQ